MSERVLLRHYAHRPLGPLEAREQAPLCGGPYEKPRGLWLSVDGNGDGWADWCASESFSGDWSHVYTIELADDANLLWLRDAFDLDVFTEQYGEPGRFRSVEIDWRRVAADFDGIIITPYVWQRRMELSWYYGWDCASGCIWNPRAIASARITEQQSVEVPT